MSESDRRHVAYHEAGHAVANCRFEILQTKATIVPRGGFSGAVVSEGKDHLWSADQAQSQVLSFCAGYAALIATGLERGIALQGCDDDIDAAAGLIADWALSGTLIDWQARAVELMSRPENIRAVDFVAKELLKHETLYGDYVGMLIQWADGNITDDEWCRFVACQYPRMAML